MASYFIVVLHPVCSAYNKIKERDYHRSHDLARKLFVLCCCRTKKRWLLVSTWSKESYLLPVLTLRPVTNRDAAEVVNVVICFSMQRWDSTENFQFSYTHGFIDWWTQQNIRSLETVASANFRKKRSKEALLLTLLISSDPITAVYRSLLQIDERSWNSELLALLKLH